MKNKTIFLNNFVYAMLILLLAFVSTFFVTSQNGSNNVSYGATTPTNSTSWTSISSLDTVWAGTGSPINPYLITSEEELAGLAYQVNNGNNYAGDHFRMEITLDLRDYYWTPIGNSSTNYFAGNFDGNGFKIRNMIVQANSTYSGLFGYVRHSGDNSIILEDIVIVDSYISGGVINGYVGMIAGYCYFNDNCQIIDCTSGRGNEIEVYNGYTGGIVGGLQDGTMDNCRNGCTITGMHVGGIVGYTTQDPIINSCYNYGSLRGQYYVGGICGYSNYIEVNECLNAMGVTSTSRYAGGIVGYANTNTPLFIRNCYNNSVIMGYLGAGGIVGYYQDQYNTISTIANCYNKNTIYSGAGDVGGILGIGDDYTIYNCFNTGTLSHPTAGTYGGGIVGNDLDSDVSGDIYGCYCTINYAIGSLSSNYGTKILSELATNHVSDSRFYLDVNWHIDSNNYSWDMTNVWVLDTSNINGGCPYLIDSSYTINYVRKPGYDTGTYAPTSAYRGQVVRISQPEINKVGYYFLYTGWSASSGLDTLTAQYGSSSTSVTTRWDDGSIRVTDEYFNNLAIDTIILEATAIPIHYVVTLVYNNGQVSSRLNCYFDDMYEIPTPTRNGYVFAGWTISGSYNLTYARQGTSSTSYTGWSSTTSSSTNTWFGNLSTTLGADVTLTAQWELATYDITYNVNGGDRVTGNNYAITLDSNLTSNGVTFSYNNITDITTLNGTASATTRCFTSEVFTDSLPNSFTVGYNLLSGSFSGTLEFRIFSSTGTSLGSYSFSDGYASNEANLSLTGSASRWMFQLNIGSGTTFDNAQFKFFCYNSSQTVSSGQFTYTHYQPLAYAEREGYVFNGWNTQVNGSGMTYSPANIGTSYTDLTLYAQWTPASYTVTFDANGGTTDITRMNVKYLDTFGSGNGGELPYAENEWFILEGWFVDGAGEAILPSTIFTYTEHIVLIAQWKDTWFNHGVKPEGEGSASSPYLIAFPEHLGWLSSQVAQGLDTTSYCKQVANIELSRTSSGFYEQEWYPIGTETHPFRGIYDGNGYKISLTSQNCRLEYYGLFGVISDATITKVYFEGDSLTSGETAGGLVAYAVGTSIISDCYLEVTLDNALEVNNFTFGAIVGYGGANCQIVRCSFVFNDNVGTDYPSDNATINPIANGNIEIVSVYYRYCTPSSTEHLYAGSDYLNGFVFSDDFLVPMSENLVWFPAENSPVTQAEVQAWVNRA